MGFEFFNSKPKKEKSSEQQKLDKETRAGLAVAAAGAVVLGGVAYEASQEKSVPNSVHLVSAEAPAPANNPTLGMKSTDAPKPISLPAEAAPKKEVVDLEEKPVVINLAEKQDVVQNPEH